ncbi:Hypothetical_protein [Hexamita inflata]|uniref:Hypothetical_protein n=1 Tax=Hexamita inflata TaxID=28002 RepID=A0ABP1GX03_9EUKA
METCQPSINISVFTPVNFVIGYYRSTTLVLYSFELLKKLQNELLQFYITVFHTAVKKLKEQQPQYYGSTMKNRLQLNIDKQNQERGRQWVILILTRYKITSFDNRIFPLLQQSTLVIQFFSSILLLQLQGG